MDAVELNYPVDVPKLMGSEGFGRGARVTEDCKPLLNSSIDCCTTSLRHKGPSFNFFSFNLRWVLFFCFNFFLIIREME